jgi:hypothetical protein
MTITPVQSAFTPAQMTFTLMQSPFTLVQMTFTLMQSAFTPAQMTFTLMQSPITPVQAAMFPIHKVFTPLRRVFPGGYRSENATSKKLIQDSREKRAREPRPEFSASQYSPHPLTP